jgi:DNA-binding transcriptional LysR family regulator
MGLAFDLRQLRYFLAIAESGSFRAAAERLHVSQPPLSRQMQDLERALGTRLLDRRASGVMLTPAGREALDHARAILAQAEELAEAFAAMRHESRVALRIGVSVAVTVASRKRLGRAWQQAMPDAALEVEAGLSRDLVPALKEGGLDFALVGLHGNVAGLETRSVHASRLAAALPARHRLARRRRVSLLDVTDLPLFWMPRSHNPEYHDFCLRYFRRIGYRPRMIIVEPGQLQTLERIAHGEGWTIPNGATLETRVRGVAYRPLAEGDDLAVRVVAAWRGTDDGGRCETLSGIAAAVLQDEGATPRKSGRPA